MNRDLGRKLISLVALSRKGKDAYSTGDFVKELVFKRNLLPAEEVEKFIRKSVENKLLIQKGEEYTPNFKVSDYTLPLDFHVDLNELYSDRERPLLDRIMEAIESSGKVRAEDTIRRAKELNDSLHYIDFNIALLAVAMEEGIDISEWLEELSD